MGECFINVREHVQRHGGKIAYGWAIWEHPPLFIEGEHHAVWEAPDKKWLDITPQDIDIDHILFLLDERAFYNFDHQTRTINVRIRFPIQEHSECSICITKAMSFWRPIRESITR